MMTNVFETEMFLFALSSVSGRHFQLLWPGGADAVERMARSCEIVAKA